MDEKYIRDAIKLAREAVSDGNPPFGSLLVVGNTVVKQSKNTTKTENDVIAHPELKLARWAASELTTKELADCTMYTSTEPCEMCASAIHYAELDRIVYSVPGSSLATIRGEEASGIPCKEVIQRKGGATDVDGPVLKSDGIDLHKEFY